MSPWQYGLIILALCPPAFALLLVIVNEHDKKSLKRYRPTVETREPHANEFGIVMKDWR